MQKTWANVLSQFNAFSAKNLCQTIILKKHADQFQTSKNLSRLLNYFLLEVKKYNDGFGAFWFELIPMSSSDSEEIFCQW